MDSIVADDRLPGAGALPQGLRLRLMQLWAVFSLYWRTGLRAKRLAVAAVLALVLPAMRGRQRGQCHPRSERL